MIGWHINIKFTSYWWFLCKHVQNIRKTLWNLVFKCHTRHDGIALFCCKMAKNDVLFMFMFMSAPADPAGFLQNLISSIAVTVRQLYPDARPSTVDARRLHMSLRAGGKPTSSFPPRVPWTWVQGAAGGKGNGFWVFSHQLGNSRPGGRWLTYPISFWLSIPSTDPTSWRALKMVPVLFQKPWGSGWIPETKVIRGVLPTHL